MTRKDYEKIAAIFRVNRDKSQPCTGFVRGWNCAGQALAQDIADMLAADNHRFDRARFLKACGLGE